MINKKIKKRTRFAPINTGRAPSKRLRPAITLLLDESISIAELANRLGMARSSLNRWFQVDDIRLSSLEEIGKVLGYHVEWKFVKD